MRNQTQSNRPLPVVLEHTVFLPLDKGKRALPQPRPYKPVLNLPTPGGWKTKLTLELDGLPVHRQSSIQVVTTWPDLTVKSKIHDFSS